MGTTRRAGQGPLGLLALLLVAAAGGGCGGPELLDPEAEAPGLAHEQPGGEEPGYFEDPDFEDPGFVDEEAVPEDTLEAAAAKGPLRFRRACEPGDRLTLAAVGDILLHPDLQRQAYAHGWNSLWGGVARYLDDADLTYGNHEGPAARGVAVNGKLAKDPGQRFDGYVYTGFPKFNYHASLEQALRDASFDIVSTANNHAMDRGPVGADRTLDAMDAVGLAHVGTIRAGSSEPWSTQVTRNGFRLRFVACTYSTNGLPDPRKQVLHCYRNRTMLLSLVRTLARRSDVDAVIVTPHWGIEYADAPASREKALARAMLDAGAVAVLGAHPHVTQPWEKYVTRDGRETFVIYSLGNFVSRHYSPTLARRSSLLLYVGLTRGRDGKAFVNGVAYMPLYMAYRKERWGVVAVDDTGGYADSRKRTVGMYGPWNVRAPERRLDTTPGCQ